MTLVLLLTFALTLPTFAADSSALSAERIRFFQSASFYCPLGRAPIRHSDDAWQIRPSAECTFNGPLDTKINRRRLEPPVLNPQLTLATLKAALVGAGIAVNDNGQSISFSLGARGVVYSANLVESKKLTDPLFSYGAMPSEWGKNFVTIAAPTEAAINDLVAGARQRSIPLFWENPHFFNELGTYAFMTERPNARHSPLPLVSNCSKEWINFGGQRSLLYVGNMHTPPSLDLLRSILAERDFPFAALEFHRNHEGSLRDFLAATNAADEEKSLAHILESMPNDTVASWKLILRTLKAKGTPLILMDYQRPYFNFPYTNTSFHGLIMATRNALWSNQLPREWSGTGLVFAGLDHVLVTPGADFQNMVWNRLGMLEIGLVNPLEKCGK